jgi:hypothetical protein
MPEKTPLQTILETPYLEVKERLAAFKAEHPDDNGTTLDDHGWRVTEVATAYKAASEAAATAKETMERCKLLLMEKMQDAAVLKTGSFVITFKAQDKAGYVVEPKHLRSMTVKKTTTTARAARVAATRTVTIDPTTQEVSVQE